MTLAALPHQRVVPWNNRSLFEYILGITLPHYTNHSRAPSSKMASLKNLSYDKPKVRERLSLLAQDLIYPMITFQESSLSSELMKLKGIERHTNLSWGKERKAESSPLFTTPLPSTSFNRAFQDSVTAKELEWPEHDLDLNGRFYSAYHLAHTLIAYFNDIEWRIDTSSAWETVE